MSRSIFLIGGILTILAGLFAYLSLFQVSEIEHAIVMQFGEPKRVISDPGLKYKHFWQDAKLYEKRTLNLDPPVETILLADQKRILVNAFTRYRIVDPLRFFQSVRVESTLRARLGTVTNSVVREVLGNATFAEVLSAGREDLLDRIVDNLNNQSRGFGIKIVDVRFRRTDLPDEVSERVYARMQSEREREAKEFRAQGEQRALEIRANADRQVTVIKAEAQREVEILRGNGEARRTRTLNDAHSQDPEFFNFYRSMQAYVRALGGENTYMVLTPDMAFFDFFDNVDPSLIDRSGDAPAPGQSE
jgi:membrane protease subunit HflC